MQCFFTGVPEPVYSRRFSGKFMVRVPPEVHRKLALVFRRFSLVRTTAVDTAALQMPKSRRLIPILSTLSLDAVRFALPAGPLPTRCRMPVP